MGIIPAEVLHQLYRDYCLARFDYTPDGYISVDARERHIDNDARSYYEDGGEEGEGGHVGALAELVEAAYRAGSEWADSVPGSWRELVFSYVNAEEGSDDCMQAWHEMESAVRHYEAVQRRGVPE